MIAKGINCDDVGTVDDRFLAKTPIPSDCALSNNALYVGYPMKSTLDSVSKEQFVNFKH